MNFNEIRNWSESNPFGILWKRVFGKNVGAIDISQIIWTFVEFYLTDILDGKSSPRKDRIQLLKSENSIRGPLEGCEWIGTIPVSRKTAERNHE